MVRGTFLGKVPTNFLSVWEIELLEHRQLNVFHWDVWLVSVSRISTVFFKRSSWTCILIYDLTSVLRKRNDDILPQKNFSIRWKRQLLKLNPSVFHYLSFQLDTLPKDEKFSDDYRVFSFITDKIRLPSSLMRPNTFKLCKNHC